MKIKGWKAYLVFVLFAEAVGLLAGLITMDGTALYTEIIQKPILSPPPIVFPIVWTVLYALMGIGAALVWNTPESPWRRKSINLFVTQLVVNFFWSLIFFNAQAFGFAFLWLILLWSLVLWMLLAFRKVSMPAAWLQIPYLLWVSFALYLNFEVWLLNS